MEYLKSSCEFIVPEAHRRFVPSKLELHIRVVLIHVSGLYFKEAFSQKMNLHRTKDPASLLEHHWNYIRSLNENEFGRMCDFLMYLRDNVYQACIRPGVHCLGLLSLWPQPVSLPQPAKQNKRGRRIYLSVDRGSLLSMYKVLGSNPGNEKIKLYFIKEIGALNFFARTNLLY